MGRDIYAFIERRKRPTDRWDCVETDLSLMDKMHLYRWPDLFALLSYNAYVGQEGVVQRQLKDWVTTLSPETNEYLFMLLTSPIKDIDCLFPVVEFDDSTILKDLDSEYDVSRDEAERWMNEGLSFLLTENIVSNPDACFCNWCSADELEWAVLKAYEEYEMQPKSDDDYLRLVSIMREHENEGYEVRMVYSYDCSTRWLGHETV